MQRGAFRDGVRDALPAVPGNIPFGMLFGATAVAAGLAPLQAVAMSVFVFAGVSQVAAVDLLARDAAIIVVIATVLLVNLRYVIYSASLAPHLRDTPLPVKLGVAYPLFDINYALSIPRFEDGDPGARWYYAGASVVLVTTWIGSTIAGVLLGTTLAGDLSLDFAIPLIFVSLLVTAIEGRRDLVVAGVAAAVAVLGAGLPVNAGLLVAVIAGVAAGHLVSWGDPA